MRRTEAGLTLPSRHAGSEHAPGLVARKISNLPTLLYCLTLCDPMVCTVHGIFQARILA